MRMSEFWYYLIVCVVMVGATSLTRGSFFLLPNRWQLPGSVERALQYAPTCALTAIIVPTVLTDRTGGLVTDPLNPRLWAVIVGTAVYAYRRSLSLMIVVGMGVFTVLRLVTP
jgi:branched-subunit amino acid transport protein